MNMHAPTGVIPPAPPKSLKDTGLNIVMMRDILLKTIFRKNLEHVSEMAEAIALSLPLTQQLVEIAREQRLVEAQGTLHAGSGSEMAFQLSDAGKARALDALSQSEYYGALPVPTLFDPIVHTPLEEEVVTGSSLRRTDNRYDKRYLLCERPTVMTGGELMLDMLDLNYNPVSRTYQASLQLKATGGVFIVDDLGRQEEPPQSLINRWIVPMEAGYDILALQSGEKFEVPFDTLVVFSTNFHPNKLFDSAALRRIFYKIKIDGPTQEEFLKVFAMVAKKKNMPLDEDTLIHMLKVKYPTIENVYANYHGNFLIDQMISICEYEGIPNKMTPDLLDRAWANMYVKDEEIVH